MSTATFAERYPLSFMVALIDIGIAAEHFCLQAAEEGLGTCMLGWFNEKSVKKLINVPDQCFLLFYEHS